MNERVENRQFDFSVFKARYVVPVLERKWMVIIFFILGLAGALAVNFVIKPEFLSRATLLIESPRNKVADKGAYDQLAPYGAKRDYVNAEVEKLKSSTFAAEVLRVVPEEVKKDLGLSLDFKTQILEGIGRLFGSGGSRESQRRERLLFEMKKRLEVQNIPNSGVVVIEARSIDRDVGPTILKGMIDVWLALNLEDNKKEVQGSAEFALEQRNQAREEFLKAEQEMIEFKKSYGIPADFNVFRDIEIQLQVERLQARMDHAKERLDFIDRTYVTTKMKEAGIIGNIKVIDPPSYPVDVSAKSKARIIFGGIALGLIVGVGLALLLEFIGGPIRHQNDLYIDDKVSVLGYIPRVNNRKS